jgi:predicted metalloprotease with PDZ domain
MRRLLASLLLLAFTSAQGGDSPPNQAKLTRPDPSSSLRYTISLINPAAHLLNIRIVLPAGTPSHDLQLPVWNALYQVRDFSQYVNDVRAHNQYGTELMVRTINKSCWRVSDTSHGAVIEYRVIAKLPGPYGAELNAHHAFFNLAEILMYPFDMRASPVEVKFGGIPGGWKVASALSTSENSIFAAPNYDRLVDSPVEIGQIAESDFDLNGARYRIVVDANPADYDITKVAATVRQLVAAETVWMHEQPFKTYLFIYHFPREGGGGGMEHAYSTAIDVNARTLAENTDSLPEVTAHEFFHLWNVKRIRPQSLEPIDYTKENYTDALWFSEGVTNTIQEYTLLKTRMRSERHFLDHLADRIEEIERRPAHLTQSAEESSLCAWLEKYPSYWRPERSISYYSEGELLGYALDLSVRNASRDRTSLQDVFLWMNRNNAQKGKFFADSDGVREAAEAVSNANLRSFFQNYVAGRETLPWNDLLRGVGLQVLRSMRESSDPGFEATRIFDTAAVVITVKPGSAAEAAGLQEGDSILSINGEPAGADFDFKLSSTAAGDELRLKVKNDSSGERELTFRAGTAQVLHVEIKELENVTPEQKARRRAWLGLGEPTR